jgi:hypothetical protein
LIKTHTERQVQITADRYIGGVGARIVSLRVYVTNMEHVYNGVLVKY